MEQLKIDLAGTSVPIAYSTQGTGETILFVHGWAHTREIWCQVSPSIAKLGFRTISIDLPGFGESPVVPHHMRNIGSYSEILAKVIEVVERKERVRAVIADSLGARIAFALFTSGFRSSCSRLLLSGCPFDGLPPLLVALEKCRIVRIALSIVQALPSGLAKATIRLLSTYTMFKRVPDMEPIYNGIFRSDPSTADRFLRELNHPEKEFSDTKYNRIQMLFVRGHHDRVVTGGTQKKVGDKGSCILSRVALRRTYTDVGGA